MTGDDGIQPKAARILESLISEDLPLQTQHYASRRSHRRACGAWDGQATDIDSEVTCEECKRLRSRRRKAA